LDFFVEARANVLKLELNYEYGKKTVVFPIHTIDWIKTTDTFTRRLKEKKIEDSHIVQLVDISNNNYDKVVGLDDNNKNDNKSSYSSGTEKSLEKKVVKKYTANGRSPLHKSEEEV
jgi:hypothetical protein